MMSVSLALLATLALTAPAGAQPETLVGKLREVSGGPAGRPEAEIAMEGGRTLVVEGRLAEDDVVLRRLAGVRVKLVGARDPERGRFVVDAYEILDVGGGQKPRLGVLGELKTGAETRLVFVDDSGVADLLPTGFAAKLKRHVGARLWMLGVRKDDQFTPTRFSIVRPAPLESAPLTPAPMEP